MRHKNRGRKLKRTHSHRKSLMRNLATALFEHKRISTTEAKAKELRPYAERLITKAKHAIAREKQGLLPDGQKIDVHNRRIVSRKIRNKAVLQELFDTIAPAVEERAGGYTRIVKTGFRRGDGGRTAIIELVDWSAPQDGTVSLSKKKKKRAPQKPAKKKVEETAAAEETAVEEEVTETDEAVEAKEGSEEESMEQEAKPEEEAAEESEEPKAEAEVTETDEAVEAKEGSEEESMEEEAKPESEAKAEDSQAEIADEKEEDESDSDKDEDKEDKKS